MATSVKLLNGSLDETPESQLIFRGVVDHESLSRLKVDKYQREVISPKKIRELMEPVRLGQVPDIIAGMRGQRHRENEGDILLLDSVYIIDGLQRVTSARELIAQDVGVPHLGIKVHINTTEEIERRMFQDLNLTQTRLSPNVTLRNARHDSEAIDALFRLSSNKAFPLCDQISWQQNMRRSDRLTASTYVKVTAMLHSHAGPGRAQSVMDVVSGLEKITENVGRQALTMNDRLFFEIVDKAWGIQRVAFKNSAPFLKSTFLIQLARVFSDHANFWDGDKLSVDDATIKKLGTFPIADPEIVRLAAASGTGGEFLYMKFVEHINSGRRTRRLQLRRSQQDRVVVDDVEES